MDTDRGRQSAQMGLVRKPNWTTCTYCKNMLFSELHDFTRFV